MTGKRTGFTSHESVPGLSTGSRVTCYCFIQATWLWGAWHTSTQRLNSEPLGLAKTSRPFHHFEYPDGICPSSPRIKHSSPR